jgi:hypothetical protein
VVPTMKGREIFLFLTRRFDLLDDIVRGCIGDGSLLGGGILFLGDSKALRGLELVVGDGCGENLIFDSERRAGRTLCRFVLGASQAFPRSSCSCLVICY